MEIDQSLGLRRDNTFDRIVLYTATALFVLTGVLATVQVTVRVLGIGSLHWTEPLARFVLIVGTYLGAAVATRNNEHIKIDLLLDKFTENRPDLRRILDSLVSVAVLTFVLIAFVGTINAATTHWETAIGGTVLITSGMLYLGIAVGFGMMFVYELLNLHESLRGLDETESQRSAETEGR